MMDTPKEEPKCACCETVGEENNQVRYLTPDIDIKPVPLCVVCSFHIMKGDEECLMKN